MTWEQIVKGVLILILIILIVFPTIKTAFGGTKTLPAITFEIVELIRCRFKGTPCLSLYPNPVKSGSNVTATIRGRIWHQNKTAYVVRIDNPPIERATCTIERERCSVSFEVSNEDSAWFTAYIDENENGKLEDDERDNEDYFLEVLQ